MSAFNGDRPAMRLDNPVHNRKSQPGATQGPGPGFIDTIEAIENLQLIFFRNADAGVAHHHLSVAVSPQQFDPNLSAFRCVLHRVIKQIQNHPFQQMFIASQDEQRRLS